MDSLKPIVFVAILAVIIFAALITYSDLKLSEKDDIIHKRDVTICQQKNIIDKTSKKCT